MPSLGDHLLVVVIAVAYPLYFTLDWYRQLRPHVAADGTHSRVRFYRRGMMELWLLTSLVLSWWLWSERPLTLLGHQVGLVRASAEARAQVRKQFRGVPVLMVPRDNRERRMWIGLSVTAGVCEEVLYRGFLVWYLMSWLPRSGAVLASAVAFGVAHLYLGWGIGVLRATVVGVVLGVAYLLTGTLWVPILLHAVVDVTSGLTGSVALEQNAPVTCPSPAGGRC